MTTTPSIWCPVVLALALAASVSPVGAEDEAEATSPASEPSELAAPDADALGGEGTNPSTESPKDAAEPKEDALAAAAKAGKVLLEMTLEQVLTALGEPLRKEVIPPDAELWHYANGEVALSKGKVTYVSLTERPKAPAPVVPRKQTWQQQPAAQPHQSVPGDTVAAPPVRAGDSYVYESADGGSGDNALVTRRTVVSAGSVIVMESLNLSSRRAKPRTLRFDREWNLLGTRDSQGEGRDYAPPLKYYDFPLYPGKTWRQTTTETHTKTGAIRVHTLSGVVGSWEEVRVPAGVFRGIRVSLQTELVDHSTGETVYGTDVSWYVPQVRRSVKSVTTGRGGEERVIQLLNYEVTP